jgi:hypothetical protein
MVRSVSYRLLLAGAVLFACGRAAIAADKADVPAREEAARESVRQALVAETLGDNTLRARKLGQAFLAAPELEVANWHLARVRVGDKWLPLTAAESLVAEDKAFAEYHKLRASAKTVKALQALARWCLKHEWEDAAQLHFAQLLARSDATPGMREEAIKNLDLVQIGGQWFTKDEVAAREAEAKAIQESLAKWRPTLKALQLVIDGPDFAKRDKAIAEMQQLDDPQMIPALESFLLDGQAEFQEQAVKRLATFPHYEATEALVRYAVMPDSVIVRDAAIEALKSRPLSDYCPLLLDALVAPIKSHYEVSRDSGGRFRYVHELVRETPETRLVSVSYHGASPILTLANLRVTTADALRRLIQRNQEASAHLAAKDTELLAKLSNVPNGGTNQRIFVVLHSLTSQPMPRDVVHWWQWWKDYNEVHWPTPTQYVYAVKHQYYAVPFGMSCFLAGTAVRTQGGLAPIESIQPGDRVLSQDQDTGELTYKLVLRTTLRPPAKMVRISAGRESITTTLGHPFWVSGHGWKMAKQLQVGDRLHSHGGAIEVLTVEPLDKPQPAHNLVVADFNSYFVGNQGLLVHDNEFRQPTRAIVPGLEK